MTSAKIIQAIRKEIISRIDKRRLSTQAQNELVSILSFLSDLEKECEEKPNSQWSEEDEEMLNSIIATCKLAQEERDSSPARHLFKKQERWLKSHYSNVKSEKPIEGLEEEAESCWRIVFPDGGIETTKMALTHDEFMMCARHFAKWGAEHAKKNK